MLTHLKFKAKERKNFFAIPKDTIKSIWGNFAPLTKFQKWIWPGCQGNNSAFEACCELPAQIFQEAEGFSNREAAVTHSHVGYTLWRDEAEQVRGEKVFSKQTAWSSVTWMPLCSHGQHCVCRPYHKTKYVPICFKAVCCAFLQLDRFLWICVLLLLLFVCCVLTIYWAPGP